VDCRRVGEHQPFELAKAVSNFAAIEVDAELIGMWRATLAELEERRVLESDGIRLTGGAENGKACHFTQSGDSSP